jgi:hypothetical protein
MAGPSTPSKKGRGNTKPSTPTKGGSHAGKGGVKRNKENAAGATDAAAAPQTMPPGKMMTPGKVAQQGTRSQAGPKLWQHPYVNVFKLCGLDQMHNATKEGDVTTVVDR